MRSTVTAAAAAAAAAAVAAAAAAAAAAVTRRLKFLAVEMSAFRLDCTSVRSGVVFLLFIFLSLLLSFCFG